MVSIVVGLTLIVMAITIPVIGIIVDKWYGVFIASSAFVVVLAFVNLILTMFNVY